ncbi:hypothetical protein [Parasitella parasitica]|uniref:Replication protein A C-terminal domain-containing protein n=1 Tax=Parasitella parasitica TaxID=35722 RepID=A0A0B7NIL0_9FUNG|nr:hypothetical protein [Parasitella parasitica]
MVETVHTKIQTEAFTISAAAANMSPPSSIATNNFSYETDAYKGKKVSANIRACIPLTIAQIKRRVKPADNRLLLEEQQSCVTYIIEDGTGSIEIKQWNSLGDNDLAQEVKPILQGAQPHDVYVKVFGRLQLFSDRISCVSHSIVCIEDCNEVSFHFLDALNAHLEMTTEKKRAAPPCPIHQIGRNNINSIVKRAIKVCGDEEAGSHISNIISHLNNMFTETEIFKSLDELADNGQIYSLNDDFIHLVNF